MLSLIFISVKKKPCNIDKNLSHFFLLKKFSFKNNYNESYLCQIIVALNDLIRKLQKTYSQRLILLL